MPPSQTRRGVLLALAGAATVSFGATSAATATIAAESTSASAATSSCADVRELESEIEARADQLDADRAALDALPVEITEQSRRIIERHASLSEPRFSSSVRSRALSTGRAARDGVIVLDVAKEHGQGTATGWFVDEHHILTNSHNVDGDITSLYGVTIDGESFEAEIVDAVSSQQPDVALLRTEFTGSPLPIGSSDSLSRDDPLVQIGHPADFGFWVISLGGYRVRDSANSLSATIPGLAGNSGSPIVDLDGEVVAMTYGGEAADGSSMEPTDDDVRFRLLTGESYTSAVPIETAIDRMEGWT